jgi:hypothetical protein
MTTNTAGAVSEEITDEMIDRYFIRLHLVEVRVFGEIKTPRNGARVACVKSALEAALGVSGWRPIEEAPVGKTMFVVVSIRPDYTTDPWCTWQPHPGEFARWPHPFPPTHFLLLPPATEDSA